MGGQRRSAARADEAERAVAAHDGHAGGDGVVGADEVEHRVGSLVADEAGQLLDGLEVDYVEIADFEPRVLAAAVRVGATRLIDNVVLEGEPA